MDPPKNPSKAAESVGLDSGGAGVSRGDSPARVSSAAGMKTLDPARAEGMRPLRFMISSETSRSKDAASRLSDAD